MALCAATLAWTWRDTPGNWYETATGQRPLMKASSWYYHLSNIDVDLIAKVDADVLVIDFAKNGGRDPLSPREVQRLKTGPTGKPRVVIAYISIGEAEEYRYYWQAAWKSAPPAWDGGENCAWPQAHMVRFWQDDWKDIIIRGPNAYLKQIVNAGFDGVYLDRIDVYEHQKDEQRNLRDEMIKLVTELGDTGRRLKPGFQVIAQNAEDLLSERHYRRAIDGLGKEDLLYGVSATGQRNKEREINWSLTQIDKLRWDWKPVFVVEYPLTTEAISSIREELLGLGLVPTFQHRSLDGSDPTNSNVVRKPGSNVGTPEYVAEFCKDKRWW